MRSKTNLAQLDAIDVAILNVLLIVMLWLMIWKPGA